MIFLLCILSNNFRKYKFWNCKKRHWVLFTVDIWRYTNALLLYYYITMESPSDGQVPKALARTSPKTTFPGQTYVSILFMIQKGRKKCLTLSLHYSCYAEMTWWDFHYNYIFVPFIYGFKPENVKTHFLQLCRFAVEKQNSMADLYIVYLTDRIDM